jgi:hypothetical protein
MKLVVTDGGRAAAGFKGKNAHDCVVRAIAIAARLPYLEVYEAIREIAKSEKTRMLEDAACGKIKRRCYGETNPARGVRRHTYDKYLLGVLKACWVPIMKIGSGCTVHLRAEELPKGRIICSLSKHLCAVIDGVLHDTHDCSRGGTRCVYGYYTLKEKRR